MKRRQLITCDEARPTNKQHTSPCSDCPWARAALQGWLGGLSADKWVKAVHGEAMIECHTILDKQCAGAAIYRANVAKLCRTNDILCLPSDRTTVFSSPSEFTLHHSRIGVK